MIDTLIGESNLASFQFEAQKLQALTKNDARTAEEQKIQKEHQYREAAKGIESIFLYMMLKEMKKTLPQDPSTNFAGGILHTFTDLQLAQYLSRHRSIGFADLVFHYFAKDISGTASSPPADHQHNESIPSYHSRTTVSAELSTPLAFLKHLEEISPTAQQILEAHRKLAPYLKTIYRASQQFHIDPAYIKAMILVESDANPNAVSPKGAKGLMQLMDETAQFMGVTNPFDPEENIFGGTKYLRYLLDRFTDNYPLAIAAYNAGPSRIEKYNGIPPFPETQKYVHRVLSMASFFGSSQAYHLS